jgi:hypothetical protein
MQVTRAITETLKGGMVNGPTLYITQKLVSSVDAAGSNVLPKAVPQELRTPLVGLVLATVPLLVSDHWLAEKVSEYTMANAVAQTLALAGNGGTGAPGVIDAPLNSVFDKIAAIGAPTVPSTGTQGYMLQRGHTAGYLAQRGTAGYVAPQPMAGMRTGMRGLTTEHSVN